MKINHTGLSGRLPNLSLPRRASAPRPEPAPAPRPESTARTTRPTPARSGWEIAAVGALALLVLAIVVVGLRTGMGALQDAAAAAHIETDAAKLYWIGVDGLIVVAIIAAMVLRHDRAARTYCLVVIGVFTAASGLLQYLHGLGWFTPNPVTHKIAPLPWGVVLVIAFLVIGMIFCATHLFVHTLRRLFPGSAPDQHEQPTETAVEPQQSTSAPAERDTPDQRPDPGPTPDPLDPDTEREIRKWFAACAVNLLLDNDLKPVRKKIAGQYGISDRQAGYVISDVEREREAAAERDRLAKEQAKAARTAPATRPDRAEITLPAWPAPAVQEPTDEELFAGLTPAEALAGPGATERRRLWREQHAATASPNGSGPAAQDGDDQS